jgi:hypothetical protein
MTTQNPKSSSAAVLFIACALLLSLSAPETWAAPATQPVISSKSPADVMHSYFRAIDSGDRKDALNFWNTTNSNEAQIAELQVDMMLAVSKLKKAVVTKIGDLAPLDLGMAVVEERECKTITDEIDDNKASVKVVSIDPQQADGSYSMVQVDGTWKLSVTDQMKDRPAGVTAEAQTAAGKAMIKTIADAADGVSNGHLHSTDEVKRKISESMGGP